MMRTQKRQDRVAVAFVVVVVVVYQIELQEKTELVLSKYFGLKNFDGKLHCRAINKCHKASSDVERLLNDIYLCETVSQTTIITTTTSPTTRSKLEHDFCVVLISIHDIFCTYTYIQEANLLTVRQIPRN